MLGVPRILSGFSMGLTVLIGRVTTDLFAIGLATPASSLVQILLCGGFLAYSIRKEKR